MKVILLVSAVFLSGVIAGCVKPKSVAAEYKAKMSAGDGGAGDGGAGDGGAGDGGAGDGGAGGTEKPTPAEGDVKKGKALLVPCAGCHPNTAKVVLNADAVARLDEAFTGKQTATHGTMTAAFEDGRLDLEAALNAIPGATLKLTAPVKLKK
ncbi:MAG: hypothetical protein H7318_12445 [Oligoflexus sp.]|nr:hypothetical protein [Oligoflexus sp.]